MLMQRKVDWKRILTQTTALCEEESLRVPSKFLPSLTVGLLKQAAAQVSSPLRQQGLCLHAIDNELLDTLKGVPMLIASPPLQAHPIFS